VLHLFSDDRLNKVLIESERAGKTSDKSSDNYLESSFHGAIILVRTFCSSSMQKNVADGFLVYRAGVKAAVI
jgi:hypothetical protein